MLGESIDINSDVVKSNTFNIVHISRNNAQDAPEEECYVLLQLLNLMHSNDRCPHEFPIAFRSVSDTSYKDGIPEAK